MCLRKIPTRLRYNQVGILRGHTWESLKHYFKTVELDKIELEREGLRAHEGIPLFEIRFGKLGTEYRCRGSHAVTDKSTASSNQANRT